jgi:hypothetical protein
MQIEGHTISSNDYPTAKKATTSVTELTPATLLLHGSNYDVKQILVLVSFQEIYDGSLALINLNGMFWRHLYRVVRAALGPEVDGVAIVRALDRVSEQSRLQSAKPNRECVARSGSCNL